jgi:hypothetical protein
MTSHFDTSSSSRPSRGDFAFRPEEELLICCARVHLDIESKARRDALLSGALDWSYLLSHAGRHGIRPLLFWNLKDASDRVPPDKLQELAVFFEKNARQNLRLAGELIAISKMLEAEGISAMAYKGPALAARVYGNLALREQCDLDILVPPQDLPRARAILERSGYTTREALSEAQERAVERSRCETVLRDAKKCVVVDLHWGVVPSYMSKGLNGEILAVRSIKLSFASESVRVLGPEDDVLAIAVHGGKHAWSQLKWVCDMAESLKEHQSISWPTLFNRTEHLGLRRLLDLGIVLAHRLLKVPLPIEVSHHLNEDPKTYRLYRQACKNFFTVETQGPPFAVHRLIFQIGARERWRDRIRHLLLMALTPTEEDVRFRESSHSLTALDNLLRPARLLTRYGRHLVTRKS